MAMRKNLDCPYCDRKFSMPGHVARHVNAIHKKKSSKGSARSGARKGGRRARLGEFGGMNGLLKSMEKERRNILAQRDLLGAKLTSLSKAIKVLSK